MAAESNRRGRFPDVPGRPSGTIPPPILNFLLKYSLGLNSHESKRRVHDKYEYRFDSKNWWELSTDKVLRSSPTLFLIFPRSNERHSSIKNTDGGSHLTCEFYVDDAEGCRDQRILLGSFVLDRMSSRRDVGRILSQEIHLARRTKHLRDPSFEFAPMFPASSECGTVDTGESTIPFWGQNAN